MAGHREFVSVKKVTVVIFSAIVALALVFAGLCLYDRSKIASIIDDEAAWDLRDSSPRMKVIVLEDGTVARFVAEDGATYTGDVQDTFTVDKKDASVEVWYACDGQGIVYLKDFGKVAAYSEPDDGGEVVGMLVYEEGYVPETYRCLGYRDGWFKVELAGGVVGYVNEKYLVWDAVDSF